MLIPCFSAHSNSLPLIYSGPLSTRIVSGFPRHSMIRLRLRMTLLAGREKSTSMPSPSRLKSSSTFNSVGTRPPSQWTKGQSCTNFQIGPLKWGCSVAPGSFDIECDIACQEDHCAMRVYGIVRLNRFARVNFRNFGCLRVAVLGDNQANKVVVREIQNAGRQEAAKAV